MTVEELKDKLNSLDKEWAEKLRRLVMEKEGREFSEKSKKHEQVVDFLGLSFEYVESSTDYDDGTFNDQYVFKLDGLLLAVNGWHSSWDDGEEDFSVLYEVVPETYEVTDYVRKDG